MPKKNPISKKEFTVYAGPKNSPIPISTLYSDIRRNKVVVLPGGLIDPNDPINIAYKNKKQGVTIEDTKNALVIADQQKKEFDRMRSQEDFRLAQIKRQKLEGELIPTELVKSIFQTHFKSFTQSFHNAAEQMATDLVKRLNGSRNDISWAKGVLVKSINEAATKGREMSAQEIKAIVDEYSETKGRGAGLFR